jgi:hypothetical protein
VVASVCRNLVVVILKLEVENETEGSRFPQNIGNHVRLYGVIHQNTRRGISNFVLCI